jgi:hypothetical protein
MYREYKHPFTNEITHLLFTDAEGRVWSVPKEPDNTDYQKYLAWLAAGNTPLPAE